MSKSLSRLYQLSSNNSEIILNIEFGQLQRGVTTIMINDRLLINNEEGAVNISLGNSSELKNRTLYCTSTVRPDGEDSGVTRLSYKISRGLVMLSESLEETVSGKDDIVIYTAEFFFY